MNSGGELLTIHPYELQFTFELNKQNSCTMQLSNNTDNHVAFKVKTTNPKKYSVRPNTGIVLPHSTYDLLVTMQAQKEGPSDLQCKDRFLLQSVITSPESTIKDITSDMFKKESGNLVDEYKLKVTYVLPSEPLPATVEEFSDEGSPPKPSVSDNGSLNATDTSRAPVETQDDLTQAKVLISRLTEEKNSILQLNNKLHQEMDRLRLEISRGRSGIPFMYIIIVGFLGIFFGYVINRS
ncbi:vesicle-associated protein 1-2-like isoform X2 [Silene latifolia]|uniref:vesicle-associated protein 1-2-like isoform X2 n=1 Tax=Silene latifolia TaxID=37657 RepID=UPI003D788844